MSGSAAAIQNTVSPTASGVTRSSPTPYTTIAANAGPDEGQQRVMQEVVMPYDAASWSVDP